MIIAFASIDYGYPWWLSYGHLPILAVMIAVLQARPQATLVASDLFGESFDQHFGRNGSPERRLSANLRAAGVDQRASIVQADMRKLPVPSAEFDGVISAYAMDHVNRAGSDQAIAEAARVLKPGGDFLLMVVGEDPWAQFAFGPLLKHGGARRPDCGLSMCEAQVSRRSRRGPAR